MPGRRRTAEQAERIRQIIELRRQRVPVHEIAERFGVTPGRISQLYGQALREIPAASVEMHRAEEIALADDATRALLQLAGDDDVTPRTRIEAWTSARGWAEHKARVIGLNAPTKVEVSDGADADIRAVAARLGVLEPGGEAEAAGDAEAGREQAGAT
jgi:hypothetical protein